MFPKVILLDLDGPLWSDRVIRHHPANDPKHPKLEHLQNKMIEFGDTFCAAGLTYWKMDDVAVGMLNKIMEIEPTIKTVISSSWRELVSRETMEYIFFMNDLRLDLHKDWCTTIPPPVDMYSNWARGGLYKSDRLIQCQQWIEAHKDEISDYVILDDPGSGGSLISDNMVQSVGLKPENVVIVNYEVGMEIDHYLTMFHILTK